jgi:hypothetical protein
MTDHICDAGSPVVRPGGVTAGSLNSTFAVEGVEPMIVEEDDVIRRDVTSNLGTGHPFLEVSCIMPPAGG